MKEFLMLIRECAAYGNLSVEDMQVDIQEHINWVEELVANGHFLEGNPLESTGVTLKLNVISDGPYIETKECVSGYYKLLANSLAEATELVKSCPDLKNGATLELREIIDTDEQQ
ncbi:YciI family protein [Sphingobacterium faecium]|uniref:YciI family protein n=1 Tax=Sphingobacterium faecium TaxID=34087 RepID=UPI003209E942